MTRGVRDRWTATEDAQLRDLYPRLRAADVARQIGRSREAVYRRAGDLEITKSAEFHLSAASGRIQKGACTAGRRLWTSADDDRLRSIFADTASIVVARLMDRSISAIRGRAGILGLHKSEAYLESPAACRLRRDDAPGLAYRYPKGHVPANKGTRRPGWSPGRMAQTQFKKGEMAGAAHQKWRPIGTEVQDDDGYLKRKIADDRSKPSRFNWKFVHVLVWEEKHGPVPPGHCLCFKNGNKADTRIENLELISRADRMRRNTIHNLPPALKQASQLVGAVRRQITMKSRKLRKAVA